MKQPMFTEEIKYAVETAAKSQWPKLTNISLSSTIKWISSPKWLLDQIGGSPLVRALNALTYVFSPEPELSGLGIMYSLMGIEALYAQGQEDSIGEQILYKTQAIFGSREGLRKKIKGMYDFRSRLVHGQLDFVPCFTDWYPSELRKTYKKLYDANDIAIAILLATFQKMIINDWKTLTFEYALREADSKNF